MQGNVEVGSRIRTARKAAKLSQKTLAERLEMEQATLSKIELGKRDARSSAIATIAEACEVSADWLLFGRGEGPPLDANESSDADDAAA